MTRRRGRPRPQRDLQKLRSEKLWAELSFPNVRLEIAGVLQ